MCSLVGFSGFSFFNQKPLKQFWLLTYLIDLVSDCKRYLRKSCHLAQLCFFWISQLTYSLCFCHRRTRRTDRQRWEGGREGGNQGRVSNATTSEYIGGITVAPAGTTSSEWCSLAYESLVWRWRPEAGGKKPWCTEPCLPGAPRFLVMFTVMAKYTGSLQLQYQRAQKAKRIQQ